MDERCCEAIMRLNPATERGGAHAIRALPPCAEGGGGRMEGHALPAPCRPMMPPSQVPALELADSRVMGESVMAARRLSPPRTLNP